MNRFKRLLTSPITIGVTFVLAIALIAASSIGGARAALTYYSETYSAQVDMKDIGVALVENGKTVSVRDYDETLKDGTWIKGTGKLLDNMLAKDKDGNVTEQLKLGTPYKEELAVLNNGTIDTYVRVTIYKYWTKKNDSSVYEKTQDIDPSAIELNLVKTSSDWIVDSSAGTNERTVLYYNKKLASGETSSPFSDTLTINSNVANMITTTETSSSTTTDGTTIYYTYSSTGSDYQFVLEATVDSVQDHNAVAAIKSAWGVDVTINDGTLSLGSSAASSSTSAESE